MAYHEIIWDDHVKLTLSFELKEPFGSSSIKFSDIAARLVNLGEVTFLQDDDENLIVPGTMNLEIHDPDNVLRDLIIRYESDFFAPGIFVKGSNILVSLEYQGVKYYTGIINRLSVETDAIKETISFTCTPALDNAKKKKLKELIPTGNYFTIPQLISLITGIPEVNIDIDNSVRFKGNRWSNGNGLWLGANYNNPVYNIAVNEVSVNIGAFGADRESPGINLLKDLLVSLGCRLFITGDKCYLVPLVATDPLAGSIIASDDIISSGSALNEISYAKIILKTGWALPKTYTQGSGFPEQLLQVKYGENLLFTYLEPETGTAHLVLDCNFIKEPFTNKITIQAALWGNNWVKYGDYLSRLYYNHYSSDKLLHKIKFAGIRPLGNYVINGRIYLPRHVSFNFIEMTTTVEGYDSGTIYTTAGIEEDLVSPDINITTDGNVIGEKLLPVLNEGSICHYTSYPFVYGTTKPYLNGQRLHLGMDYSEGEDETGRFIYLNEYTVTEEDLLIIDYLIVT